MLKQQDNFERTCKCGGKYRETLITDDWDGTLHCDSCNKQVKRWIMEIKGFNGKYRFLSNFYPATIIFDDLEYTSVEHAYQAAKTEDKAARRRIREMQKPGEAKRAGKQVKMRTDWEKIKFEVMKDLVLQKFSKHKELKEKLLATGDAYLEETNTWGDFVWGVCKGKGQNWLGKILMEVREEIKF